MTRTSKLAKCLIARRQDLHHGCYLVAISCFRRRDLLLQHAPPVDVARSSETYCRGSSTTEKAVMDGSSIWLWPCLLRW